MARHEVVIHENKGATQNVAPYTGSYISKETVAMAEFAKAVGDKCGLPPIQVIAILGGAFDAISELERDALVRVHTDLGVVCGVITGSFPTADAAFDPARNSLTLSLRLDDSLRLDLADTVPTIVTDAEITKLRVDSVMDIAEQKPMNLVRGRHVFRVAGYNMVLDDAGAAVFMQNALGTTFPVVVDQVVSKQLFTAHTSELLAAGDYKLVVKSRGGDAEGPLQSSSRKVKYLRVEDPEPEPEGESSDGTVKVMSIVDADPTAAMPTSGHQWKINGEGLRSTSAEGDEWLIDNVDIRGDGFQELFQIDSETPDHTQLTITCPDLEAAAGDYTATLTINLSRRGGEETEAITINQMVRIPQA